MLSNKSEFPLDVSLLKSCEPGWKNSKLEGDAIAFEAQKTPGLIVATVTE